MTKQVSATIRWLSPEEGGRQSPPTGPEYKTLVRFEDERDRWPNEAWTLVVRFLRPLDSTARVVLANIGFLVDEAPAKLLRPGTRFELCEGPHVVAKGVILPSNLTVPDRIDDFAAALLG